MLVPLLEKRCARAGHNKYYGRCDHLRNKTWFLGLDYEYECIYVYGVIEKGTVDKIVSTYIRIFMVTPFVYMCSFSTKITRKQWLEVALKSFIKSFS